ncbi:transposase [Actinomyces bowdenii]
MGSFEIEVPRDRAGSFTPRLVRKGQRPMDGLDACESSACTPVG